MILHSKYTPFIPSNFGYSNIMRSPLVCGFIKFYNKHFIQTFSFFCTFWLDSSSSVGYVKLVGLNLSLTLGCGVFVCVGSPLIEAVENSKKNKKNSEIWGVGCEAFQVLLHEC